jgi:hypothetical protein
MTPEECREMDRLARLIQDETNPAKFMIYAHQMLELIHAKARRISLKSGGETSNPFGTP